MNRIVITTFFTFIVQTIFSQNNLEPALEAALKNSDGATVHALFRLRQQWNSDSAIVVYRQQKLPANLRAKITINEVKKFTKQTQESFLQKATNLKKQGVKIQKLKPFWCANIIAVWGSEASIRKLAEHPDVEYVYYDHTDYKADPVEPGEYTDEQGQATHGLKAIAVQKMWELGYTGRGRKALGVDTGVNTSHPTFAGRFLGEYLPISQSFYPYNNPVSVDISSSSHGTHTIGTVLGRTAINGDTIGVAPNAYFMISDPIVSRLSEVRRLSEILECFEWALNPDGNFETVNDLPDVITNSWGLKNSNNIADCDRPETLVFNVLDAAGVALVFSAGNNGPGSGTIGMPAHIARSTTNIFSVGALNTSISSWNIADFSSRGPTNCPAELGSPLHLKPEVVAPGVNVFSAQGLNDYGTLSGTSMAAPHVAGAVLILREAFPQIASTEILEALYYSAVDLGTPGEDNTFGNGLINLWNAFQWLSQNNTPAQPVTGGDLQLSVAGNFIRTENDSVISFRFSIQNLGTSPVTVQGLTIKIEEATVDLDTTFSIPTGLTTAFARQFPMNTFPLSVYNQFRFYLHCQNDIDTINNHAWVELVRPFPVALPYIETFENAQFDLKGAKVEIQNFDNSFTWRLDTIPQFGGSQHSASMKFRYYNLQFGQRDNMNLFPIVLNNPDDLYLGFQYAYAVKSTYSKDTLMVMVSTDGVNFNDTVFCRSSTTLATVSQWMSYNLFLPNTPSQWRYVNINLSHFRTAEKIWIRFQTINRDGNDLFVDNIAVYSGNDPVFIKREESGVDETPILYPNPTNGEFYVKFGPTAQNPSFQVFDLSGRPVPTTTIKTKPNIYHIKIFSSIPGIYYVLLHDNNSFTAHPVIITKQ